MKIYDISKFTKKNEVYELATNYVYVTHTDTGIKYVATDSFRLVEIHLENEIAKTLVKEGFYDADVWKILSKAISKKERDEKLIASLSPKETTQKFPEYARLIPTETKPLELCINRFDISLVVDLLKLIKDFSEVSATSEMKKAQQGIINGENPVLYYSCYKKSSTLKILLMPLNM